MAPRFVHATTVKQSNAPRFRAPTQWHASNAPRFVHATTMKQSNAPRFRAPPPKGHGQMIRPAYIYYIYASGGASGLILRPGRTYGRRVTGLFLGGVGRGGKNPVRFLPKSPGG